MSGRVNRMDTISTSLKVLLDGFIDCLEVQDREIKGLSLDSRKVKPGYLFFAYPGEGKDGRDYISEAIARQASVVLAEASDSYPWPQEGEHNLIIQVSGLRRFVSAIAARFYHYPSQDIFSIGVTGTNGKTSICYFIQQIFNQAQRASATLGTLGTNLNGSWELGSNTTPDPIAVQSFFSHCKHQSIDYVAMEVSSHALVQYRVEAVCFDVAVFTNLSHEHLDYHGSMQAYLDAKMRLFQLPDLKTAIINLDSDYAQQVIARLPNHLNIMTYSLNKTHADIHLTDLSLAIGHISATIVTPWGSGSLNAPLTGMFNASNLLAVIGVSCLSGLSLMSTLGYAAKLQGVPGRMQLFAHQPRLMVDYAHSPDALKNALQAIKSLSTANLVCIFGCGGERDKDKRALMGAIAERYADKVIICNDNPRSEDPQYIVNDILSGLKNPHAVSVILERTLAISHAIDTAKPEDIILVAGKGHEPYQIIGDKVHSYSDIEFCQSLSNAQRC